MQKRFIVFLLIIGLLFINLHCKPIIAPINETGLFLPANLEATLWAESPMIYNPTIWMWIAGDASGLEKLSITGTSITIPLNSFTVIVAIG